MSEPVGRERPEDQRTPGTEHQARLEEIVADYLLRKEDGEPVTVDDYLVRYPRYAEELASLLTDRALTDTPLVHSRGTPESNQIGPYAIVQHVASGGGGTVYEARDVRHGQRVALKILDRLSVSDPRDFARFQREATILRELDLVNVVPVLETGEDHGRHYIAMRWIDGGTLGALRDAVLDPSHRLAPFAERARLVAKVARTLAIAHERGILHRDVKPSNILVDRLGEPVVIDFGISARDASEALTGTRDGPFGTPRYLPPELLTDPDPRPSVQGDVYGLGLCLYEFVCGVPAFVQKRRADLYEQMTRTGVLPPRATQPSIARVSCSFLSSAPMNGISASSRAGSTPARTSAVIQSISSEVEGRLRSSFWSRSQ